MLPPQQNRYVLDLEGVPCGHIRSIDDSGFIADVVDETPRPLLDITPLPAGLNYYVKKHLGAMKNQELTLEIDFSLVGDIYTWIGNSWRQRIPHSGAIVTTDAGLVATNAQVFYGALITETTIPTMDASSNDPCYLTLKIVPEYTRFKKASGNLTVPGSLGGWRSSGFRLEIDGLDCTHVKKIEAFTVRQKVAADNTGEVRNYEIGPGLVGFPNLKLEITSPESPEGQTWLDWCDDFMIKGKNGDIKEKYGILTFLTEDMQELDYCIRFFNLGIYRLTPTKLEDGVEAFAIELYCERMEFLRKDQIP